MRLLTKPTPFRRRRCLAVGTAIRVLLLGMVWRAGLTGPSMHAQGVAASEYDLKAACVLNFIQWVKWPSGPGATVTIGILGDDPFGGAFEKIIQGGMFNGRKVAIKRSRRPDDFKGCQIVFVPGSERGNISGILAGLAGANILTVGENDGFVKQGGVIGFISGGERMRFEINNGAAQRNGLEISSRLLNLATKVGSW